MSPFRPSTNVVLILADYMGYGDIGPTGVPDIRTPSIDRLAREGVLFTDCTAAAPICSPSRAAILTGRHPARIGLEENVNFGRTGVGLPADEVTVARSLRDAGYATGLFGKWHLGEAPPFDPLSHGFDDFLGFHDWSIDYYTHRMSNGLPGLYRGREPVTVEGYATDVFTDEAVRFIEASADRPFFAFVSYNAALPPHQPPGRPDDVRDASTWNDGTRADHCAVVEGVDAGIGRILAALERAGVADDTVVAFTYDHGGKELSRRTPFFHGFATLWEGGIRVPLLLRWPGRVPAGEVRDDTVTLMDLAPTFLAAAGLPGSEVTLDGLDLLPCLMRGERVAERMLFWRLHFRTRVQQAARRGRWKYVRDVTAEMLFDVENDPGERVDLAYERPGKMAGLRDALADWQARWPSASP